MAVEAHVGAGYIHAVQDLAQQINDGGAVTQAANVPQLTGGESPTEAEFNALLTALKDAGLMVAD